MYIDIEDYADELEEDAYELSSLLSCDDAHCVRAAQDNSVRKDGRHLLQTRLCGKASGTFLTKVLWLAP